MVTLRENPVETASTVVLFVKVVALTAIRVSGGQRMCARYLLAMYTSVGHPF